MTYHLTIALAQLNPTLGRIDDNLAKLRAARAEAAEGGADLIVTSELFGRGERGCSHDFAGLGHEAV